MEKMMEKTSMDKIKFDSLHEILPGRESWRIKVRVLRMWKVPGFINPSEPNSMEMVLVDEKVWICFFVLGLFI
jgi:hypothetical protein